MASQAELTQQLSDVTAQVAKIGTETSATLQKVAELEEVINNLDEVSPELQSAFDALKAQVQAVDDLVVDAPVEPPVEPPTEEPTEPTV